MAKMPWIKFYGSDWKSDAALTGCSPATRGIWMDWIIDMHAMEQCGELTGTLAQLARRGRCTEAEADRALAELEESGAASVTPALRLRRENVTQIVTLRNRRMYRAKVNADRQKRHRDRQRNAKRNAERNAPSNASVTPQRLRSLDIQTSSSPNTAPIAREGSPWEAMAVEILDSGMGDAKATVESCRANGVPPEEARAIIDHWLAHRLRRKSTGQVIDAWTVGALCHRLKTAVPGADPTKGWPAQDARYRQVCEERDKAMRQKQEADL